MIKVQLETADGVKMYVKVPEDVLRTREILRHCMMILRIDGKDRLCAQSGVTPMRNYVLWTRLKNGIYVFREDL